MADPSPLVLGSVIFQDFWAPEDLAFPAAQALAVHDLIGGRRIIQTLGVVWRPIVWEGVFYGSGAVAQSQLCWQMLRGAVTQRLTYGDWALDVIVDDYTEHVKNPIRIEYKISCTVLRDASGKATTSAPSSIDAQTATATQRAQYQVNYLSGVPTQNVA